MLVDEKRNEKSSEECDYDNPMSYQHHSPPAISINQKTTQHSHSYLKQPQNEYTDIRLYLISILNNHKQLFRILQYSVNSCRLKSHS